ncbi:unnamed protein product [Lasius platythorax]|uniref:Reverse transcriptase Ty1/copia-type domain-containing protein n=1 Tax=Lasius platythorax TaxID=488582 RepID=A0AAV2NEG0_9HYME
MAQNNETRKVGRPKGLTSVESMKRKEKELKEREDRLKEEGVRRSARLNKESAQIVESIQLPSNINEARDSREWEKWKEAMEDELESLDKHKVWHFCERPKNAKVIKSKWIFSKKGDNNDNIKYKTRLVAAGYQQLKNQDYDESYSPVINIDAWRILIAIAAKSNLNVRFFDVKTAYLYGEIKETVYLELPPGFDDRFGKGKVCNLKKSLYGLPQSGRVWFYKLKEVLIKNNLKQLASKSCIFTNSNKACFFVFSSYVDDFTILDNDNQICEKILNLLRKEFEIRETTQSKTFLGMKVESNNTGIYLSQTEYIEKLLYKYGMSECKPVNTPIERGEEKGLDNEDNVGYDLDKYQEIIGELLYLANRTRPDLAFVTSYLSQYNHCPLKVHYKMCKRILRYLNNTKNKRLCYNRDPGMLKAYSDASWGNAENGKSFSGGVIFIGNSIVSWKCRKQRIVGNSTCEVELYAVSEIVKDIMWLQNMLTELKCEEYLDKPTEIYCDNQATIQWIKNAKSSNKTRHVNLKFHFVRDEVENGNIVMTYVNTKDMIADCLTKSTPKEKFMWCCEQMRLI